MGTRADFYVGTGANAEWLGSIAYDGHPDTIYKVLDLEIVPMKHLGVAGLRECWRGEKTPRR